MRNMIVSAMAALVCVACAAQTEPTNTAQKTDDYTVQGFALKIDPGTQKVQKCTPPYDPSCSSYGPDDELRCIPTSKTTGDCSFRHSDNAALYDGADQTNGYIPCPGTGLQADDDYCTSVNPYQNKKDFVSVCLVTEATFSSTSPDAGRCAYFFKECTVAANTPCEQKGITLPCSNSVCECSVSADLTKKGVESCDNVDNNCDGQTDEEDSLGCKSFWTDADGDGYGSGGAQVHCMCGSPVGMVANNSDCNDSSKSVNPMAAESCNGVDDNCDGQTDEGVKLTFYADADGDLHGNPQSSLQSCTAPSGYVTDKTDCNDLNKSVNPMAAESCNGVDDNCDGQTDEGTQLTFYADADGDTYGDASKTTLACVAPSGYVADKTDCNDGDKGVNPNAADVCNQVDDDCDGQTDVIGGQYQCDLQCPTVQKFDCNKEYSVDFSAQPGTSVISSYQCWTAAGAKTLSTAYNAVELTAAPNAPIGTKFSFQITSTGTGALAALLHNTCEPNKNSSAVTAYNLANNLNGTCAAFSSSSVNNGVAGSDYIALDKPVAVGVVKFKFVCAP